MTARQIRLDVVDSTNAEALRRAADGERGPLWIVAARQSAGRGRQGRSWDSDTGNLYATLLVTLPVAASVAAQTSFVAALAVLDIAERLLGAPEKLALKWPNDVLLDGAKLSGILIETVAHDAAGTTVAIGIGVNLVHAPDNTRYGATSLAAHGARAAPDEAFALLAAALEARLAAWNDGRNFAVVRRDWTARAAGLGRPASVTIGERTVLGEFTGLASDGALLLSDGGGQLHVIHAGEVSGARGFMSKLHRTIPRRFDELVFLPLGGAGEIGMNMYLYGLGDGRRRQWIMVDCGVKFGDERDPGIDVILPDTAFIEADRRNLLGIVLTHAHEDHMGAVAWLWSRLKAPIYCTPFAAALVKGKLKEAGLLDEVKINVVPLGARFDLGPFDIELVSVTHSIPEPNAVAIRTALGTVVHTGDWKLDRQPTIPPHLDEARMKEIGAEGVRAVVGDSTNVLREGFSPSESEVEASLARIIADAPGRVAITTFASHVGRLTSAIRAARTTGREVVTSGRSMRNVIEAAKSVGLLKDVGTLLEEEAFGYLPRDKTLILCTGSQGEPRAMMSRIAEDTHPRIALEAGDTAIFSSRVIPGNEKAVAAVVNGLARGIGIIAGEDALVQTSGHPRQGEMKLLYSWLKPEVIIPVHGEMRHLMRHKSFARECGVPEAIAVVNGDLVRLAPGPAAIVDKVPAGRLHVDGKLIVPADGPVRPRRKLAFGGIVLVSLVLDATGALVGAPTLIADGLPQHSDTGEALDGLLLDVADQAVSAIPRARRREDAPVIEAVRIAVRRHADALWGKKPVCHVVVHRV